MVAGGVGDGLASSVDGVGVGDAGDDGVVVDEGADEDWSESVNVEVVVTAVVEVVDAVPVY